MANDLIEWVNATGHVISMATDELDLDLVFNPADLSSNNTTYTCRISNHITSSAINISLEGTVDSHSNNTIGRAVNMKLYQYLPFNTLYCTILCHSVSFCHSVLNTRRSILTH